MFNRSEDGPAESFPPSSPQSLVECLAHINASLRKINPIRIIGHLALDSREPKVHLRGVSERTLIAVRRVLAESKANRASRTPQVSLAAFKISMSASSVGGAPPRSFSPWDVDIAETGGESEETRTPG